PGKGGEPDQWFARSHERPFIAKVSDKVAMKVLIDDPYRFRGRDLVPGSSEWEPAEIQVTGKVEGNPVNFRVQKKKFNWVLMEPRRNVPLDTGQDGFWGMFLDRVRKLSVEKFIVEGADPATLKEKYGLGESAVDLKVTFLKVQQRGVPPSPGGKELVHIRLGRLVPEEGICYARVEGKTNVIGMLGKVKTDLAQGHVRFLDRKLVPIEEPAVEEVAFTVPGTAEGKKVHIVREGTRWIVKEPAGVPAVEGKTMEAALGFDIQRAQKYIQEVDDPSTLPEKYGLNPPQAKLELKMKRRTIEGIKTVKRTLFFGHHKDNDNLYAMYAKGDFLTGDLVFLIGNNNFNLFMGIWKAAYK
ncbi:MAG: DUF4340 domain-containing protein, partial [Planctomycetota bacterium]